MRITDIASCVLTVPTREPMARNYPQQKLVVAEIATDEGVRGLGYSLVFGGGGAEAVHAYLEARLKLLLLGEDPLYVERLWEKMFRADIRKRPAEEVIAQDKKRLVFNTVSGGRLMESMPCSMRKAANSG